MPTRDKADEPIVVVIDDDLAVREALKGLFGSVGMTVAVFACVDSYIKSGTAARCGCLVLDVRLPGKSGLEFIEELARAGTRHATVFISGHADISMSVRAMKAGAVEFLTKPVREQELLDAVQRAIEQDLQYRAGQDTIADARAKYATLTPRERAVITQVVIGRPNRQIAQGIGITEATVKLHRGQIMKKMHAGSLIELVRIADLLAI